jgi:hypothetical protein
MCARNSRSGHLPRGAVLKHQVNDLHMCLVVSGQPERQRACTLSSCCVDECNSIIHRWSVTCLVCWGYVHCDLDMLNVVRG